MSRRPPRRQREAFRPLTGPQLESLLAPHGTPPLEIDCERIGAFRRPIRRGLATLPPGVRLIAEPGRTMGAYTAAHATDFNFIPRARIVAVNRRPGRLHAD
jgi:hypothetical protein